MSERDEEAGLPDGFLASVGVEKSEAGMADFFAWTQVVHYAEDDTDCGGDYYSIELKDENGKVIARFGDQYHDNGWDKVEGFIAGVEWATKKKVSLKTENVADGAY